MSFWLYSGDCLEVLRTWPEASFDAVVTDPPYELTSTKRTAPPPEGVGPFARHRVGVNGDHRPVGGFMGKEWDGTGIAFSVELWTEVLRVLKPGGHLLAFGGTRTYHRMACAIEDAGFEIRDSVDWLYGCLDAESEALTRRGWVKGVDLIDSDEVCQWAEDGTLSWAHPQRILVKPYAGDLVVLKNRHVEMHLTPDHRVPMTFKKHSRDTHKQFGVIDAGAIKSHWVKDFAMAGHLDGPIGIDPKLAYLVGWWLTDAWIHGDGKAAMFSQSKPQTLARLRSALAPYVPSEYTKAGKEPQHADEHTFYVTGPLAEYLLAQHPERRLTWTILSWSYEARLALFEGLMDGDGSQPEKQDAHAFWAKPQERRDVFSALCVSLGFRAYDDPENFCVNVNLATNKTEMQAKHKITREPYNGLVWCVTVDTGYFIARRNGRPFVTGNSGFPKSQDLAREFDMHVCQLPGKHCDKNYPKVRKQDDHLCPAAPGREQYAGWHTALKGAHEPVVLARKELEGTLIENVLKYGTGALNVDGCRIATKENLNGGAYGWNGLSRRGGLPGDERSGASDGMFAVGGGRCGTAFVQPQGRWPANVILSEEVALELDAQTAHLKQNGRLSGDEPSTWAGTSCFQDLGPRVAWEPYSDSGGASRYFYVAKPSRKEKELGCDYLGKASAGEVTGRVDGDAGLDSPRAGAGRTSGARNLHPTVKSITLMRYLCRLVTPVGGTVLDPFMGSGTTGIAALQEGFKFVGIEKEWQYLTIANARITAATRSPV